MKVLQLIVSYIPAWIWAGLGGIIGLGLFALALMIADYLQ